MTAWDSMHTPAGAKEMVESAFRHIEHPRKRAFLRAYALCGRKGDAARQAGIHPDSIYNPSWRHDSEFQEALKLARTMVGDLLEAAMIERGVEGVERVRFNRKTGEPLRDPLTCEVCGQSREEHLRTPEGEPGPNPTAECDGFEPAIYTEREYSDRLLEQLARSHLPERYADRLHVSSIVAKLDMSKLPDVAVARIANGEDPQAVLATVIAEGGRDAEQVRAALPTSAIGRIAGDGRTRPGEIVQEDEHPTGPDHGLDDELGEEL
jgi:hypothetical protein